MTVLGVIPARGGSKGISKKNLCLVGGISLLGRAISCCLSAKCLDTILVSTDDERIQQEALIHGAEAPFLRPAELATDTATTAEAVAHALAFFEESTSCQVEILVLVEPTNPFRTPKSLRSAVDLYYKGGVGSVIGVCQQERKPEYIFLKQKNGKLEPLISDQSLHFQRRQEMKHLCRLSSTVYVVGRNDFFRHRTFIIPPIGYVDNTMLESINVDEPLDLEIADLLAHKKGI